VAESRSACALSLSAEPEQEANRVNEVNMASGVRHCLIAALNIFYAFYGFYFFYYIVERGCVVDTKHEEAREHSIVRLD
jgi:hypothetical protein